MRRDTSLPVAFVAAVCGVPPEISVPAPPGSRLALNQLRQSILLICLPHNSAALALSRRKLPHHLREDCTRVARFG